LNTLLFEYLEGETLRLEVELLLRLLELLPPLSASLSLLPQSSEMKSSLWSGIVTVGAILRSSLSLFSVKRVSVSVFWEWPCWGSAEEAVDVALAVSTPVDEPLEWLVSWVEAPGMLEDCSSIVENQMLSLGTALDISATLTATE